MTKKVIGINGVKEGWLDSQNVVTAWFIFLKSFVVGGNSIIIREDF